MHSFQTFLFIGNIKQQIHRPVVSLTKFINNISLVIGKKTEYNQSTIKLQSIQNPKWDILFLFFYLGFLSYTLAFTRTTGKHACFISKWSGNLTDQIPEKWRYKKKKKSQELKHISSSFKKHWKAYSILYSTIILPLSSYKQSSYIFHQSSPFRKVSPRVLPQMALPCLSKVRQTIYQWNPCLDHFLLAIG